MKYTQEQLNEILRLHELWLNDKEGGQRANLYEADLSGANLSRADLYIANFSGATLRKANFSRADLHGADLSGTDFCGADLTNTIYENRVRLEFQYQKDIAWYMGLDEIAIGCQRHPIKHWLDNYVKIGKDNEYTEEQIEKYGSWIKYIAELHKKEVEE